jgi:uncharacterized membrane protein YfcA
MTAGAAAAAVGAGIAAGTINTVVGSGTLVTFPVLLGLGYGPLVANVSNSIGLVPGGVSGVIGYRRELVDQGRRVLVLSIFALMGGLIGGALLLELPASDFRHAVPVLILVACGLVVVQPVLRKALPRRDREGGPFSRWALRSASLAVAVYGGYFGAAQGVILISVLGLAVRDSLQRLNAVKNVLALMANTAAGVVFAVAAPVSWPAAAAIAAGSILGGVLGARIGRRLSPAVLRGVVVVVGLVAAVRLLV